MVMQRVILLHIFKLRNVRTGTTEPMGYASAAEASLHALKLPRLCLNQHHHVLPSGVSVERLGQIWTIAIITSPQSPHHAPKASELHSCNEMNPFVRGSPVSLG